MTRILTILTAAVLAVAALTGGTYHDDTYHDAASITANHF